MSEYLYIAHVCLNSKLPRNHKDYCERGFIAESTYTNTITEQCWKYCPECEAKGFPIITPENRNKCKRGKNIQEVIENNKKHS